MITLFRMHAFGPVCSANNLSLKCVNQLKTVIKARNISSARRHVAVIIFFIRLAITCNCMTSVILTEKRFILVAGADGQTM